MQQFHQFLSIFINFTEFLRQAYIYEEYCVKNITIILLVMCFPGNTIRSCPQLEFALQPKWLKEKC